MLEHPDLIHTAPANYRGLYRKEAGYRISDISHAIDRSPPTWYAWGKQTLPNGKLFTMPQHVSAYMALLGNDHPKYEAVLRVPGPRQTTPFPPVPRVSLEYSAAWLQRNDITAGEVEVAFGWEPGNKQYSVRTIGNDGVAWAVLLLMADQHPVHMVEPREGKPTYALCGLCGWRRQAPLVPVRWEDSTVGHVGKCCSRRAKKMVSLMQERTPAEARPTITTIDELRDALFNL